MKRILVLLKFVATSFAGSHKMTDSEACLAGPNKRSGYLAPSRFHDKPKVAFWDSKGNFSLDDFHLLDAYKGQNSKEQLLRRAMQAVLTSSVPLIAPTHA